MITVDEARARLLHLVVPRPPETVPLRQATARVLARDVVALRDQPPFAASAMDGYAVSCLAESYRVIGEAAAGHGFEGRVTDGDAVRIFTGAPMPPGATRVIVQEDVICDGDRAVITGEPGDAMHVRAAGIDFRAGHRLRAPRRLAAAEIALCAAMGHGALEVTPKPDVAILMTGDELVAAGAPLGPHAIPASNGYGIAARLEEAGGAPRLLPIARDDAASLRTALQLARGADLVITIGGASVGDHDLIADVAGAAGLDVAFHRIAMRPGKPLLGGRIGGSAFVGLPGNPVSAMVCTEIFILPMFRRLQGLPPGPAIKAESLAERLPPNGAREHYMRGRRTAAGIVPAASQDSSLLSVLCDADVLIRRPSDDAAREVGDTVDTVWLR